jgi:hypothetical protein
LVLLALDPADNLPWALALLCPATVALFGGFFRILWTVEKGAGSVSHFPLRLFSFIF